MNKIPFDPYDFFGYLSSGLVVTVGMELVFGFPKVLGQDLKLVDLALLLLGIYVAGQMVATPAKAVLEDGLVDKILKRPSVNLFLERKPKVRGALFPGFYQMLPEPMRRRVLEKARSEGVNERGEALFVHVRFRQETLTNERLMARLDSFVNKYGFTRNLSFTSLIVGIGLASRWFVCREGGHYAMAALIVGVLLLYRYLKFFRQYSYELFNVYGGRP